MPQAAPLSTGTVATPLVYLHGRLDPIVVEADYIVRGVWSYPRSHRELFIQRQVGA